MENNLKERYIYAVTRYLPVNKRDDVEEELSNIITQKLAENSGGAQDFTSPSEQGLKAVLTELGPPEERALTYIDDERKSLISGVYFLMYKRTLLIVLPIVAAVLLGVGIMGIIFDSAPMFSFNLFTATTGFTATTARLLASIFGGLFNAFAIITIIFAVLNHMKVNLRSKTDPTDLPEMPELRKRISTIGPIISIIVSIALTVIFLRFPQLFSLRFEGEWIPAFNADTIRTLILPVLIWTALEIGVEIAKLVERQYTVRLAVASVLAFAICAICVIVIFTNTDLVNPDFVYSVNNITSEIAPAEWFFENVLARPNMILLAAMMVGLLIETAEVVIMAFWAKR